MSSKTQLSGYTKKLKKDLAYANINLEKQENNYCTLKRKYDKLIDKIDFNEGNIPDKYKEGYIKRYWLIVAIVATTLLVSVFMIIKYKL